MRKLRGRCILCGNTALIAIPKDPEFDALVLKIEELEEHIQRLTAAGEFNESDFAEKDDTAHS